MLPTRLEQILPLKIHMLQHKRLMLLHQGGALSSFVAAQQYADQAGRGRGSTVRRAICLMAKFDTNRRTPGRPESTSLWIRS
jgi:hypothetical protein